jgi:hypothetical protein
MLPARGALLLEGSNLTLRRVLERAVPAPYRGMPQVRATPVAPYMDPIVLAQHTLRGLRIQHKAHRRAAAAFDRRATFLGVATVIVTTVAGTTYFSSAASSSAFALKVVAGCLSITAAVLAALQTALKYTDRCAAHAAVSHHYGILRRSTEELLATVSSTGPGEEWVAGLKAIRKSWNDIDDGAPHVPQEMYDAVVRKLMRTGGPERLDALADAHNATSRPERPPAARSLLGRDGERAADGDGAGARTTGKAWQPASVD